MSLETAEVESAGHTSTNHQSASHTIDTLLMDLDGTLYPIENGYEDHVRQNIFRFMHERLGVPQDKCKAVWRPLFAQTNQSLKVHQLWRNMEVPQIMVAPSKFAQAVANLQGLRVGGYKFDTDEYWDFIRGGREEFLKPNPEVRDCLLALPQKKWVFTNCNEKHAHLALQTLQIDDLFEGVLGADFMGEFAKPDAEAFQKVLDHVGSQPGSTAMFEDSLKNLRQAKSMGLTTILIQSPTMLEEATYALPSVKGVPDDTVDATIAAPTVHELHQHIPQLLK